MLEAVEAETFPDACPVSALTAAAMAEEKAVATSGLGSAHMIRVGLFVPRFLSSSCAAGRFVMTLCLESVTSDEPLSKFVFLKTESVTSAQPLNRLSNIVNPAVRTMHSIAPTPSFHLLCCSMAHNRCSEQSEPIVVAF